MIFTGTAGTAHVQNLPFVRHDTPVLPTLPASLDVQFLRDGLAAHFDFSLVLAGGGLVQFETALWPCATNISVAHAGKEGSHPDLAITSHQWDRISQTRGGDQFIRGIGREVQSP